jgi:DNA-binding PadR family transcriptional regulator
MTSRTATTTTYAVLGLLAIHPWSTYELTRQMQRSLGRFWPRAESKLYEEPKKLVHLGYAEATTEMVGKRARTVYSITAEGRAALSRWVGEPGAGPLIEFEQLIKLSFAEHGTRTEALHTVAAVKAWAVDRNAENLEVARRYAAGTGAYQHRAAQSMLAGAFLTDFYAMVANWADWAAEQIANWPEVVTDAVADPAALREIERRATW